MLSWQPTQLGLTPNEAAWLVRACVGWDWRAEPLGALADELRIRAEDALDSMGVPVIARLVDRLTNEQAVDVLTAVDRVIEGGRLDIASLTTAGLLSRRS